MIRRVGLVIGITFLCATLLLAGAAVFSPQVREVMRGLAIRTVPGTADALRQINPVPLADRLSAVGFSLGQPVLLRLFKEEKQLELWMKRGDRFEHALTIPICAWSGALGPKLKEGDGQSPEGFYLVSPHQLNPNSTYYRALNTGFPNAFDKAQGRTGSFLMIHGDCLSAGCYAMTDAGIDDIYTAVENALGKGQSEVPVHIFPFRLSAENLAAQQGSPWSDFWQNLAEGDRLFAATGLPPRAFACGARYGFAAEGEPEPGGCTPIKGW